MSVIILLVSGKHFISHYWFLAFCHSWHTSTCDHVQRSWGTETGSPSSQTRSDLIYSISWLYWEHTYCGITKIQQREKLQACFDGGIKYTTLVRSTLKTLRVSRYIHKTWCLMSDLISYSYNIMSSVTYNWMRCQSARQGFKTMATDGTA